MNRVSQDRRTLTIEDRLAIHELANRYGNAVDARDWNGLSRIFDSEARFVIGADDPSPEEHAGIAAIVAMMESGRHPVSHHVTNIVVDETPTEIQLLFKVLGTGPRGRVGSADYRDIVRLNADGWRIVEHLVTFRRAETSAPDDPV